MANKSLEVYYHKQHVGTLAEMPDKRIAFQYSSEWQKNGFSINPLSLPLSNTVYIPPEKTRDISYGLFGIFADSIPDSWGQLLLDRYLSSINIDSNDLSILDKLAYVGNSGMGALEYYPSKSSDYDISTSDLNFDEIAKECHNLISSQPSNQLDKLFKLGGSSGGTRPKILITENNKEWIVKFPAHKDPSISGKREFDYSICAKKCGIPMTETILIPSSTCEGYFKTERFDRQHCKKIFTATFAGLLDVDFRAPTCDYATYMKLIQVLTKDNLEDKKQMFNQMCFNVLTHNRDDHTKNFSFIYTEENSWRLAPAYDITYSTTYYGEHTTSVNGKGKEISDDDFIIIGTQAGLSGKYCEETISNIKNNISELQIYMNDKPKPRRKKIPISQRVEEIIDKKPTQPEDAPPYN